MHPNLLNKWNEVILGPFLIYLSLNKCLKKKPCTKSFLESLTHAIGWTKKAVLFSLATILRSKTLLIYLSLYINRHYHIRIEWQNLNKRRQRNKKNCKGNFKPSLGETWIYGCQGNQSLRKEFRSIVIERIKTIQKIYNS